MKKIQEWLLENLYNYNPQIDGPPLNPNTINGAETQIRTLARNLRTTFRFDPRFAQYKTQIDQAAALLDQAANHIGNDMPANGDFNPRTSPYKIQ